MLRKLRGLELAGLLAAWIAATAVVGWLVVEGRAVALARGERAAAGVAALVEQQIARTFQAVHLTLAAAADAHHLAPRPAKDDPEFQAFMQAFRDKTGAWPIYPVFHMAQALRALQAAYAKALEAGNGEWPDTEALVDAFEGLRTIKTFAAEARYQRLLDDRLGALTAAQYQTRMAMALPTAWSWLASALVAAGVLWYGGGRVLAGQLTAGELLVLAGMVTFYLGPVQRLPATALTIRAALIALDRARSN